MCISFTRQSLTEELVRHVDYPAGVHVSSQRLLVQTYVIPYPFKNHCKVKSPE